MIVSESVLNMSIDELKQLRITIKKQLDTGAITKEDYYRGDLELTNLIISKGNKNETLS